MDKVPASISSSIDLSYFLEWGGTSWEKLLKKGIDYLQPFPQQTLLELGPRNGKMAAYFALQGASVTGLDIREHYLDQARLEAKKWKVDIEFKTYDGDLSFLPDNHFDCVFTKSVLTMNKERDHLFVHIHRILKPGGKIVFLENGKGSLLLQIFRQVRHRKWNHNTVRYFDAQDIDRLHQLFQIEHIDRTYMRPVYLIMGRKA
jgi:SAM-dependent methyltransferase